MSRRVGWIVGGAVVTLLAAGALLMWLTMPGDSAPARTPTPSAAATHDVAADAQAALEAHLEECTAAGAPSGVLPEACGIRIPWGAEFASVTDVRFRIDRMPDLALTGDDGFTADGGVLVATGTGTGQDGTARTETYRTDTWSVRGGIEDTDDGIVVSVW
ncbi:hypothetical protein [Microbacterium sp. NPDC089696]|uniref:hypothetical protein n=1 Tax=Microbacterium sp. NPDC089696 TaxID=3364199 RepID=UPI003815D25B